MNKKILIIAIAVAGCAVWYWAKPNRRVVKVERVEDAIAVPNEIADLMPVREVPQDRASHQDGASVPVSENDEGKFLDVMWPFLPEKYQRMLEEAKAGGQQWVPKTFSEMASGVELVGYIANSGKLMEFYAKLQKEAEDKPDNLNLLRMMVLVSSIQGFPKGEYEKNLARLAQLDSNADVLFPYAQMQLENGHPEEAYSWIQKNLVEHPDQAPATLTSALRILTNAKATEQKALVVGQLKELELDAFQADCCGRYLFDAGDMDDAAYFYQQNVHRENNPFFQEAAQVRLCKVQMTKGLQGEETISTLMELALNSNTPAIKAEAVRALSSLNVEIPQDVLDNLNNTDNATNQGEKQ